MKTVQNVIDSPEVRAEKRRNLQDAEHDVYELEAYGYHIHYFKPWHWRVSYPDTKMVTDVWPTVRKVMPHSPNNQAGEVSRYPAGKLFETVHIIMGEYY